MAALLAAMALTPLATTRAVCTAVTGVTHRRRRRCAASSIAPRRCCWCGWRACPRAAACADPARSERVVLRIPAALLFEFDSALLEQKPAAVAALAATVQLLKNAAGCGHGSSPTPTASVAQAQTTACRSSARRQSTPHSPPPGLRPPAYSSTVPVPPARWRVTRHRRDESRIDGSRLSFGVPTAPPVNFRPAPAAAPCRRVHGAGLDLPDALRRHAVFGGQLVQRGLVVAHPAALQNGATAVVEPLHGRRQRSATRKLFHSSASTCSAGSASAAGR